MKFLVSVATVFLLIALLTSCNRQEKTKARIFERKHFPQDKLQIKYEYTAAGQKYTDSVTINNDVLEGDSITVLINAKDPSESVPDL